MACLRLVAACQFVTECFSEKIGVLERLDMMDEARELRLALHVRALVLATPVDRDVYLQILGELCVEFVTATTVKYVGCHLVAVFNPARLAVRRVGMLSHRLRATVIVSASIWAWFLCWEPCCAWLTSGSDSFVALSVSLFACCCVGRQCGVYCQGLADCRVFALRGQCCACVTVRFSGVVPACGRLRLLER